MTVDSRYSRILTTTMDWGWLGILGRTNLIMHCVRVIYQTLTLSKYFYFDSVGTSWRRRRNTLSWDLFSSLGNIFYLITSGERSSCWVRSIRLYAVHGSGMSSGVPFIQILVTTWSSYRLPLPCRITHPWSLFIKSLWSSERDTSS